MLLAVIFLFTGGMKLLLPINESSKQMPIQGRFLRFIGMAEVLGALGLILPGLLRNRTGLTPIAAGLVVIMVGATAITLAWHGSDGDDPSRIGYPCCIRRLRALVAMTTPLCS